MNRKRMLLILICSFFISCSEKEQSEKISTDINRLKKNIILFYEPKEVKWLINNMSDHRSTGPTDLQLFAVLTYEREDIEKIVESTLNMEQINNKIFLEKDFVKNWFPDNIKKAFFINGEYVTVKNPAYISRSFSKYGFNSGFYFIDDNKVFVFISY